MKLNITLLRQMLGAALALILGAGLGSCTKDSTDSSLQLFYSDVVNIGPSMEFESKAPTSIGGKPSDFQIAQVLFNDANIQTESFSLNPTNGALIVKNSSALEVGTYKISVMCMVNGASKTFKEILTVVMIPSTPETIEFDKSLVTFDYGASLGEGEGIAKIAVKSSSVTISKYALKQEQNKEYFSISAQGVVSLNPAFKDVPPGLYNIIVGIVTPAGTQYYDNVLKFDITSKPIELLYTPAMNKIEFETALTSAAPALKGSLDQLTYTIKSVTPANNQFKIDAATGVVSLPAKNTVEKGEYALSITATNKYGATDFSSAYTVTVVDFIKEVDNFSYADVSVHQGLAFSAPVAAGLVGDEVSFAFEDPNTLSSLSIDAATGTITALKGNNIALGTYNIKVKASNIKGEKIAILKLLISENTNFFTKLMYGNNLLLTPSENYAYQYAIEEGVVPFETPSPTTDAKSTAAVTYEITKNLATTATIDAATGVITVTAKSNPGGYVMVRATTGAGTDAAISVEVPVFFNVIKTFPGTAGVGSPSDLDVRVKYKPFVAKINPITGGRIAAPTITGYSGSMSAFKMDFRRSFTYTDLKGRDNLNGTAVKNGVNLLTHVWNVYYGSTLDTSKSYGQKNPVSTYGAPADITTKNACYVDPKDYSVVINPGKWRGPDGEWANGIFTGQMTISTAGDTNIDLNNGAQLFPLIIWFDENFQ